MGSDKAYQNKREAKSARKDQEKAAMRMQIGQIATPTSILESTEAGEEESEDGGDGDIGGVEGEGAFYQGPEKI